SSWLNAQIGAEDYAAAKKLYAQYADAFYNENNALTHFSALDRKAYWVVHHQRAAEFSANIDFADWLRKTFADKPIPDAQKEHFYGYIISGASQTRDFETVKSYARKIVDEASGLKLDQRLRWL